MHSAAQACGGDQILAGSCIYSSHHREGAASIWVCDDWSEKEQHWFGLEFHWPESSWFALVQNCRLVWWVAVDCFPPILLLPRSKYFLRFQVCETINLIPVSTPWPSDMEVNLHHKMLDSEVKASIQARKLDFNYKVLGFYHKLLYKHCKFINLVGRRWFSGIVTPVDAEELFQRGTIPAKPTLSACGRVGANLAH